MAILVVVSGPFNRLCALAGAFTCAFKQYCNKAEELSKGERQMPKIERKKESASEHDSLQEKLNWRVKTIRVLHSELPRLTRNEEIFTLIACSHFHLMSWIINIYTEKKC